MKKIITSIIKRLFSRVSVIKYMYIQLCKMIDLVKQFYLNFVNSKDQVDENVHMYACSSGNSPQVVKTRD